MDKKVWLSRRALKLHVVILIVVPAFLALCLWQISRALGGNSLSWAYVFEWPIFAAYAIYMWWRLVHEAEGDASPPATADVDPGGRTPIRRHRRPRRLHRTQKREGRGEGRRRAGGLQRLPVPAGGAGQGHRPLRSAREGWLDPRLTPEQSQHSLNADESEDGRRETY